MDVAQLKRIPIFKDAPEEGLAKIAPFAESREFPKGATVMKEAGFSNDIFAIEDGSAEVTKEGKKVAKLGKGDLFGEAGLLEDAKRNATVTATSPLRVISFGIFELKRLKRSAPEIYQRIEDLAKERKG